MPYEVKAVGGKKPWAIVNKDTRRIVGRSLTKEKAQASMRARYAAMGRAGEKKK